MYLCELITFLEGEDQALVLPVGFARPHSYRGFYDELAFEPAENVTVGAMLSDARSALNSTFEGWKGGEFVMGDYTPCWLAVEGHSNGDGIGPVLLRLMIAAARREGGNS